MRTMPPLPYDPLAEQWELLSEAERYRYYKKPESLRDRLADFIRYQGYFAVCDLTYIEHQLLASPGPEVLAMLERIAGGELGFNKTLLVTLWAHSSKLGGRQARWLMLGRISEREAICERR